MPSLRPNKKGKTEDEGCYPRLDATGQSSRDTQLSERQSNTRGNCQERFGEKTQKLQ